MLGKWPPLTKLVIHDHVYWVDEQTLVLGTKSQISTYMKTGRLACSINKYLIGLSSASLTDVYRDSYDGMKHILTNHIDTKT